MIRYLLFIFPLLFFSQSCTNLEDAKLTKRNTFIRFYGSGHNYSGQMAEADDSGFILVGNIESEDPEKPGDIIVIKADASGNIVWENKELLGASANAVKVLTDGYLITADGIKLNNGSEQISELVNTKLLLAKIDRNGSLDGPGFSKDSIPAGNTNLTVDFHGYASTVLANGNIVTLGSFKVPGGLEKSFTIGFNADLTPQWFKYYDLLNFEYVNTPSIFLSSTNDLIWASSVYQQQQSFSRSYQAITSSPINSGPLTNYSLLGETEDNKSHRVADIQPAYFGYACIGTYENTDKSNKNIYFSKIGPTGTILKTLYFDGEDLDTNTNGLDADSKGESLSEDTGNAVVSTKDGGFVLTGTFLTTPTKGNGGTDIILIKLDAFGKVLWHKLLGGAGNEYVSSIRELSDGSLLLAGTSALGASDDVKSMFLIKTDKNGDLND